MNVFESVDRLSVITGPSSGARFNGQIGVPISEKLTPMQNTRDLLIAPLFLTLASPKNE